MWFTMVLFTWDCLLYSILRNIRKESSCSCIQVRRLHSSMYYKPGARILAHKPHHSMYLFLG